MEALEEEEEEVIPFLEDLEVMVVGPCRVDQAAEEGDPFQEDLGVLEEEVSPWKEGLGVLKVIPLMGVREVGKVLLRVDPEVEVVIPLIEALVVGASPCQVVLVSLEVVGGLKKGLEASSPS
jgi:hypothetical protein